MDPLSIHTLVQNDEYFSYLLLCVNETCKVKEKFDEEGNIQKIKCANKQKPFPYFPVPYKARHSSEKIKNLFCRFSCRTGVTLL